jgi:hypothetical protein
MTKKELSKRLSGLSQFMSVNEAPMERVSNWMGTAIPNVFAYGAVSERCMERQLAEAGKKRITTFMSDLSIGEWVEGRKGVLDTCKNAISSWKDNEQYMAEFVLCVNWKSWEHAARKNVEWSKFYSLLYEWVRDFVYDYYEGNDEKVSYVWSYLD